jgi:hypothetical protein
VKAISLWQPWATAMAIGLKTIETRHWSTQIRGLVAIHASKRWQLEERMLAAELAEINAAPALLLPPLGAIVAIGRLVGIERTERLLPRITATEESFGNYGPGRFGWLFEEVTPLEQPIPYRGAQGFFDVPVDLTGLASVRPDDGGQCDLFASSGP